MSFSDVFQTVLECSFAAAHAEIVPVESSRTKQKRNFSTLAAQMMFLKDPVVESGETEGTGT